uniref:Polyprotein n=1 Tax=Anthurium amnicola TaxID=1678845 RepID=A0A1D1YEV7_9ARAE
MKSFFTLLLIALIATFAIAHPSPHGERSSKEIHVSSPGPGPWAVKSSQAVNWWSLNIDHDASVTVEICDKDTGDVVFKGKGKCGTGTLNFKVGEDWNVKHTYFARVSLDSAPDCEGESGKFKIFKTDEYGYESKKYY